MDARRGQNAYGRRSREERRSLSESLADGTSKFFNSMVAKKNGLFSDLSSKIENTFAVKVDTVGDSTEELSSPPTTPATPATPPPRPPPPKRLPSMGSSREKDNVMKRMASMPAYTRTDSKPEFASGVMSSSRSQPANHKGNGSEERFSVNGMNVSFDEPIYNRRESNTSQPVTDIPVQVDNMSQDNQSPSARRASGSLSGVPKPRPAPRPDKPGRVQDKPSAPSQPEDCSRSVIEQSKRCDNNSGQCYNQGMLPNEVSSYGRQNKDNKSSNGHSIDNNKLIQDRNTHLDNDGNNTNNERKSGANGTASDGLENRPNKQKAPKFTTTKRRSSTVDEMLFDDYVEPEVDVVFQADAPPENLICFEPDSEVEHNANSSDSSSEGNDNMIAGASVDSSDAEFGGAQIQRSASAGSEKSWSSNYSVDSQPDDVTLECMEFMKSFVDKVFRNGEDITQTEKAKFGELCQHFPGRLWFSRYVNSQRVHNKKVTEAIFFRLMQYFAVSLFECNEAEDFSPAKTLMNMCFTFYYEVPIPQGQTEKVFLYMYMRDQPIWQSLRFWNAAYFDAVQCERSRRPMSTNLDESETVSDDKQFQENLTFGQLGTFACNMRAFGLSKELCLEFLRKQSTIANLRKDQVKLLRDNIEKVKET